MAKIESFLLCALLAIAMAVCNGAVTSNQTLGVTQYNLIATGAIPNATSGESNLADLYCKALLAGISSKSNLTVCLLNGGSFSDNIYAGTITTAQLSTAYKFNDTQVRLAISGDTLLSLLQQGVTAYPSRGAFPQVGNIRYSFLPVPNFQSPTGFVTHLVNAQLTNDTTVYGVGGSAVNVVLVTNSYVARGGDGYGALSNAKVLSNSSSTINTIVAKYIDAEKNVGAPVDGRIVDCSLSGTNSFCTAQNPSGGGGGSGGSGGGSGGGASSSAHATTAFSSLALMAAALAAVVCPWV